MSMTKSIAIIVAAGRGRRAGGGVPKQFRMLLGKPVIAWSAGVFQAHSQIEKLVIVYPEDGDPEALGLSGLADLLVEGGPTRSASVSNALEAVADCPPETPVLIHDAARPGLNGAMIEALLDALKTADAAAPALVISDAVKEKSSDGTLKTVERARLRRVQTPQVFAYGDISKALSQHEEAYVDDLEAIEALGKTVTLVDGHERLGKITYEEDFGTMARLLSSNLTQGAACAPRMGTGYDVHQFGAGDHVTLCGVHIPHTYGLVGHSDADIGWHALTDAILGAIAKGDIGDHFPPSDPQWRDADSGQFLAHAQKLAREAGYAIANVDITLICEAPKIKPHRDAMRARTADLLGIGLEAVSVKATTTEGLGFTGRREGMAGQASAVLMPL